MMPRLICLLSLFLGFASPVIAGDVRLVSDTFELVCSVEVSAGPDAPDDTRSEFHADVRKGWSITRPDKLCYRRPSTPDNCESGMTQWRTKWKCAESTGRDTVEISVK
jgi:hypothetical protein